MGRLGKFGKLGKRHPSTYGFFSLPAVVVVLQTRGTGLVFICTPSIFILFIRIKYDANDINDVQTGRAAGSRRYNADRQTDRRTDLSHRPTCTYVNIIIIMLYSYILLYTWQQMHLCSLLLHTCSVVRVCNNIIMHIKICTAFCHHILLLLLLSSLWYYSDIMLGRFLSYASERGRLA